MKTSVMGDPAWGGAISNLVSLFDPKAEAEGATMLAKRGALEAEARYNTAKAAGAEDQNSALAEAYLEAAGYSKQEIAAMRAARSNSVNDIAKGVNTSRGGAAITKGDLVTGLALTDQAAAMDDAVKAQTQTKLLTNNDGTFNSGLAAALAGGMENLGGNIVTLDATGKPIIGGLTAQGNLYNTQGVNDTSRTTSQNNLDTVRGETIVKTGDAMVDLRGAQTAAVGTKADNDTRRTDATVDATNSGAANKTRETDARINRINANINNDAVRATAAAAADSDPVKKAQGQATLRGSIDNIYAQDFSENLGSANAWEQVDPAQKKSLTDRALEYVMQGADLGTAMKKSEADHGLSGKMVKGKKDKFFGITSQPNGKISFDGFTAPSALAAATAAGAAPVTPATPAPAPAPADNGKGFGRPPAAAVPAPIEVKTQADIDNAPSGAILIVNGKRMRKP